MRFSVIQLSLRITTVCLEFIMVANVPQNGFIWYMLPTFLENQRVRLFHL